MAEIFYRGCTEDGPFVFILCHLFWDLERILYEVLAVLALIIEKIIGEITKCDPWIFSITDLLIGHMHGHILSNHHLGLPGILLMSISLLYHDRLHFEHRGRRTKSLL